MKHLRQAFPDNPHSTGANHLLQNPLARWHACRPPQRAFQGFAAIVLVMILLVGIAFPVTATTGEAYPDVPMDAGWKPAADLLTQLGILQGTPSGLFLPESLVTREQFAKMAVATANLATEDNTRQNATRFSDVPASRWSSGWIGTAVESGLLMGYADGRFHPGSTITYAQVLTVCLRMLGYDTSALSGSWPNNVLTKASTIGLTDGFSLAANAPMSLKECAVLLAALLQTDTAPDSTGTTGTSGSSGTTGTSGASVTTASTVKTAGATYAESTGLFHTFLVLADAQVDRTLNDNELRTSIGTLNNTTGDSVEPGREVRAKLDGTRIVKVYGQASDSKAYPIKALTDGILYYQTGSVTLQWPLTADMTFYDNTGSITYGDVFSSIQAGSQVTFTYDSTSKELQYLHFSQPDIGRTGTYTELLVLDTNLTSTTLSAKQILTDKGILTLTGSLSVPGPGVRIGAVVNGTLITSIQGQLNRTEQATLLQSIGTEVVQIQNGETETMDLPLSATWYHKGQVVTSNVLSSLLSRCSSLVYGLHPSGDRVEYVVLYDPIYSEPQFADQQEAYDMTLGTIDLHDVLLSRAGDLLAVYEIRNNDIAYEVTDIWGGNRYVELYQGQYIGVIEAYAPNRFAPESLTLSVYNGQTGRSASQTFSFSPEFPVSSLTSDKYSPGDSVILLTGRDGKIVRMYP